LVLRLALVLRQFLPKRNTYAIIRKTRRPSSQLKLRSFLYLSSHRHCSPCQHKAHVDHFSTSSPRLRRSAGLSVDATCLYCRASETARILLIRFNTKRFHFDDPPCIQLSVIIESDQKIVSLKFIIKFRLCFKYLQRNLSFRVNKFTAILMVSCLNSQICHRGLSAI